jgi:hypothetical protein
VIVAQAIMIRHFNNSQQTAYGYSPESSKSTLIVPQKNYSEALIAFEHHAFTITTGSRYLGGFIGEKEAQDIWIKKSR